MMTEIVLDKSYLDGATTMSVMALCDNFQVLMSEELFFELMTTEIHSQKRCFSKLPDRENPVVLIPNVGSLLRLEAERQRGCAPLSQHRVRDRFVFNRKLREGGYRLEGEVAKDLTAWRAQIDADTRSFADRWVVVHQFFPELNGIKWKEFPAAVEAARHKTAADTNFVRQIYASFLSERAPPNTPRPEALNSEWATFRWVQCQILAALRLFQRYQGRVPEKPSVEFWRRAEHSMLDAYYVILGSLSNAIATLDSEIREDFLLLCPDAIVVSPGVLKGVRADPLLNSDACGQGARAS